MLTEITNRSGEPLYASAADAQGGRNHPESVDELPWNRWTICSGISGRFELECVVDLRRNTQLGSFDRLGVIRADASWGTGADIQELVDLGLTFIVKGFSNRTALNFAARVAPTQWESLDLFTRICDLGPHRITNCRHLVPVVLVELMTERYDRPSYSHLYTTLSPEQADAEQIFTRYNDRQSIEALLKSTKYGLSIEHLRTRRSYPMENFLQVAAITFNHPPEAPDEPLLHVLLGILKRRASEMDASGFQRVHDERWGVCGLPATSIRCGAQAVPTW